MPKVHPVSQVSLVQLDRRDRQVPKGLLASQDLLAQQDRLARRDQLGRKELKAWLGLRVPPVLQGLPDRRGRRWRFGVAG